MVDQPIVNHAGRTGRTTAFACLCSLILVFACRADRANAPETVGVPSQAFIASGANQEAPAGEPLPDPVAILVLDQSGAPVSGVHVEWTPQGGGVVDPVHAVTGHDGIATTMWTLGPGLGDHTVLASIHGFDPVVVHANAAPPTLTINTVHALHLSTPDGSGQTVHPDFVSATATGRISGEFLAITPYPFGNAAYENPSLYTSTDRVYWKPPPSAVNPVVLPQYGFLSDPDIVFNPVSDELWMYYRQVDALTEIKLIKSPDGVTWSDPVVVTSSWNLLIVSPTVVRRSETDWLMWSVNGQEGCSAADTWVELRHSTDGVAWSAPEPVSLTQPGFKPWHIDVQWIASRNEYWALYNVKTPESCSTPALYLATSPDGVVWTTYPSPVLARGEIPRFNDIVYRSSFRYRPETDVVSFYYSGAAFSDSLQLYIWTSAVQRRQRADVFAGISVPPSSARMARILQPVPPLHDPP